MVISPIVRTAIVSLAIYIAVLVAELLHSADSVHEGYPFTINAVRWGIENSIAKFLLFAAPVIALFHRYFTNLSRYVIEKPSIRQLCAPAWIIQFIVVPVYILIWLKYIGHTKRVGDGPGILAIPIMGGQFAIVGSIVIAGLGVLLRWLIPRKRSAQEVIEALHLKAMISSFTVILVCASLFGVYAIYRNASTCNTWMELYTRKSGYCMGEYLYKLADKNSLGHDSKLSDGQLEEMRRQCGQEQYNCLGTLAVKLLEPRLCPDARYTWESCLQRIARVKKDTAICDGISSSEEQLKCLLETSNTEEAVNIVRKIVHHLDIFEGLSESAKTPEKVKYLNLNLSDINKESIVLIAKMKSLKILTLRYGQVEDHLKYFPNLQGIEVLNLIGVRGDFPDFIYQLENLRCLRVSQSYHNQDIPISNKIIGLKNLEKLDLSDNRPHELPAVIAKLTSLKELGIGRNEFSEKSLNSFKKARPDVKLSEHVRFPTPLDFELAEIAKQEKGVGSHGPGK